MLQSDACATPLAVPAQRTYRTTESGKSWNLEVIELAGVRVDGIDGRAETIVDNRPDTCSTKFLVAEMQRVISVIKK